MDLNEARLILAGHYTAGPRAVREAERVMMEAGRQVTCTLDGCDKTSAVDEPTGMALESGWLSTGRGATRRYFCSEADRQAYLKLQVQ
jgi:hypothetical protein